MGLLGLIVTLLIGQFVYRSYVAVPEGASLGTDNIRAVADVVGVKNDLLAMANAERAYMALNGRYAPLEDLFANGDLLVDPKRERQGYVYSAQVSDTRFLITAMYTGQAAGMPTLSINDSMQLTQQ
jgi:hypothetical protein